MPEPTERELWMRLIAALRECREIVENELDRKPPPKPELRVVKGGDDG